MSNDKYTGPWAPGMLYTDNEGPPVRIVNVPALPEYPDNAIGDGMAPGVATYDDGLTWFIFGDDGTGAPDWTDSATVGALAGVVRKLYTDPYAHTQPVEDHGRRRWICRVLPPGDKPMHLRLTDFYADTEHDAWLAAYHAHRDAAGTTATDIEVIRA